MVSLIGKDKFLNQPIGIFSVNNINSTSFLYGFTLTGLRYENTMKSFLIDSLLDNFINSEKKTIHETFEIVNKLNKLKSKRNFGVNPDNEERIVTFFVKKPDLLDSVEKIYIKANKDLNKKAYFTLDISADESSLALYLHGSEISEDSIYSYIDDNLEPYIKTNKLPYYYDLIIDRLPV